jgi:hypothetical protein
MCGRGRTRYSIKISVSKNKREKMIKLENPEKYKTCSKRAEKKHFYFYAGIVPGKIDHEYLSGTLSVNAKVLDSEQYQEVIKSLEETYGDNFSMLNFNYLGETYG